LPKGLGPKPVAGEEAVQRLALQARSTCGCRHVAPARRHERDQVLARGALCDEVDGLAVMGEFSDRTAGAASTLDAPVIRVKGMAFMGAVRVETRMPGEGVMEAWKRRLRGY